MGDASTVFEDASGLETTEKHIINEDDAMQILIWYCNYSLLDMGTPTKAELYVGDVDRDGDIDCIDSSNVLKFVTYALRDQTDDLETFVENECN